MQEVEKICPRLYRELPSDTKMTARELFTHTNKDMVKAEEEWMKGTATSYIVIEAFIITIMFIATFTIFDGNDQNT